MYVPDGSPFRVCMVAKSQSREGGLERRPTRALRVAGYLAILFGIAGALSGLVGAGTFIPYANASTFDSQNAGILTAVAAVGTAVSLLGVVAGCGLLRARSWAWGLTTGSAVACVATVAIMTAVWPSSWGFLVVAAVAYALEFALLFLGRESHRALAVGAVPG